MWFKLFKATLTLSHYWQWEEMQRWQCTHLRNTETGSPASDSIRGQDWRRVLDDSHSLQQRLQRRRQPRSDSQSLLHHLHPIHLHSLITITSDVTLGHVTNSNYGTVSVWHSDIPSDMMDWQCTGCGLDLPCSKSIRRWPHIKQCTMVPPKSWWCSNARKITTGHIDSKHR